jgi:hypothetical protein
VLRAQFSAWIGSVSNYPHLFILFRNKLPKSEPTLMILIISATRIFNPLLPSLILSDTDYRLHTTGSLLGTLPHCRFHGYRPCSYICRCDKMFVIVPAIVDRSRVVFSRQMVSSSAWVAAQLGRRVSGCGTSPQGLRTDVTRPSRMPTPRSAKPIGGDLAHLAEGKTRKTAITVVTSSNHDPRNR